MNAILAAALIGGASVNVDIATDARYALRVPALDDRVPVVIGGFQYFQPKIFPVPADALINQEGVWTDGRRFVKAWQERGTVSRVYNDGGAYGYVRLFP